MDTESTATPRHPETRTRVQRLLAGAPAPVFVVYAVVAAFTVYFCMYAFRKPFSAGAYEGLHLWGSSIELKTAFVISQILGYLASKWLGVKICSEAGRDRRVSWLLGLIVAAQLALLLFAVLPVNFKVVAIFFNGLPLGMVWGLVVLYLEGRRTSELLLAGLSCSFILASGVVKSVGLWLILDHGISEFWMPFITGLLFLLPYFFSVWMLNQLPQPDTKDMAMRVKRVPMDGRQRWEFFKEFLPGMLMLLVAYFFLTAYRDFRDNYMREILEGLGFGDEPALLTKTELPVAFGVLGALGLLFLIRNNRFGFIGAYIIMVTGLVILGAGTWMLDRGMIRGDVWVFLTGLGAYLAYVPFGSVLFDRLIAATRVMATAVFAIYVADAIGYTGSVGIQLFKDLFAGGSSRLDFFRDLTYVMCGIGVVLMIASLLYFLTKMAPAKEARNT